MCFRSVLCGCIKVFQEKGRKGQRDGGKEREGRRESDSAAGGGLLQTVSFRLGDIISYWGGVETN